MCLFELAFFVVEIPSPFLISAQCTDVTESSIFPYKKLSTNAQLSLRLSLRSPPRELRTRVFTNMSQLVDQSCFDGATAVSRCLKI